VAKAQKYSKSNFWMPAEAIWRPRHGNVQNGCLLGAFGNQGPGRHEHLQDQPSGSLPKAFGGQGTEILKINFLQVSWVHFAAAGNAQHQPAAGLFGLFCSKGAEPLKINSWVDLVTPAWKCSTSVSWRLSGIIWWSRHRHMLKISLLEGFPLVAKARKCSKSAFWGPPGSTLWPRHENTQNHSSGILLELFGSQGTKILKSSLLKTSSGHFVAKAQKYSKSAFWESPGTVLWPKHENTKSLSSGGLLGI